MSSEQHVVLLSPRELTYLRSTSFLPRALAELIENHQDVAGRYAIHLTLETAEEFRSAFTSHLAKVGFGENYELTNEGAILEDLIDDFYID